MKYSPPISLLHPLFHCDRSTVSVLSITSDMPEAMISSSAQETLDLHFRQHVKGYDSDPSSPDFTELTDKIDRIPDGAEVCIKSVENNTVILCLTGREKRRSFWSAYEVRDCEGQLCKWSSRTKPYYIKESDRSKDRLDKLHKAIKTVADQHLSNVGLSPMTREQKSFYQDAKEDPSVVTRIFSDAVESCASTQEQI